MTDSKREARAWWTDGEYISNHMDETEEQLLESDFFQVVEKEHYDSLLKENQELKERTQRMTDSYEYNRECMVASVKEKNAEITRLREALEQIGKYVAHNGDTWVQDEARKALARADGNEGV